MEESNSSEPRRCPCGFWGSTKTSGLCSKCYKEHIDGSKDALDSDIRKPSVPQASSSLRAQMDPKPHSSRSNPENLAKKTSKSDTELQKPKGDNPKDLSVFPTGSVSEKLSDSASSSASPCKLSLDTKQPLEASSAVRTDTQEENKSSTSQSSTDPGEPDENRGTKRDSSVLSDDSESSSPQKPGLVQKNKKRCYKCSCKLELAQRAIGRCRCGLVFCPLHRLPELHECDFDHKEDGREKAREKMIKPTRHLGTSFRRLESDS